MRGKPNALGIRNPLTQRIFHPAGQFNPRPTLSPNELALPPPATNYTVAGLEGFTDYEFQVICENNVGKAASPWVTGKTLESSKYYYADERLIRLLYFMVNLSFTNDKSH